ncbi:MAG TPA: ATP-binding protein [Candidatus Paceibacterota bacterium]|nr:ATP-binding protein [Candidatus Paceibacterota bacterium]
MPTLSFPSPRTLLISAVLFLAYLITAQASLYLYQSIPTAPALLWPASGIALAGIILGGFSLWPAIFLASLVHQVLYGGPLLLTIALVLANTLQPVAAAWLLQKAGFRGSFSSVRHTVAFILVATLATLIVPLAGTVAHMLSATPLPKEFSEAFMPWWIAQVVSAMVITPLLLRWLPSFTFHRPRIILLESWLSMVTLGLIALFLYWTPVRDFAGIPVVYLILVPFLWIALRIGPRFMTLAIFLNATLALGGTAYTVLGDGALADLGYALLQTQIFVIMLSYIFLLLVAIAEERKDTANDLRENVRRLEDAIERIRREDEAKSRFIATLAHELRNPLAPLMSSLEIMKLEQPDRKTADMVDGMTEHLKTMRHLLNDLLDISRITREKLTIRKERTDLLGVAARSIRTVRPLLDERDHTLLTDFPDEAVLLEGDPVRLEQIFVNLLNNAAKYTEPGGTITFSIRVTGFEVLVTVQDTGIGMDERLLEHVFEPFYQIEQPGKLLAGLGIGLSLTRNLVEMHGGRIEATSEGVGRGSTFIVRLPLTSGDVLHEELRHTNDTQTMETGLKILVVDDNRAAADALAKLLALRGHRTHAVYAGQEAIDTAPAHAPDVILLDIGLPDMEGYEVARTLKELGVTATLVALTGYGQESDIRKAEKAGFAHHLTKPAGLAEIEEILHTLKPE